MTRPLRWGGVALLLFALGSALLLSRLRSGPGLPVGQRTVEGLDGPVEVLWDSLGIPHVWATTQRDAFFAQGFLHASHRLWQVEMFRRVARGRLSEIFGETTLETDRFLRTLGLHRAAEAGARGLRPETVKLLESYAAGLNAAVEGWRGLLPPEFLVLGFEPGPFELSDVLALEKIMAWDLSDYQSSLDLARAHARLGEEKFGLVAPFYPETGPTILGSAGLEGPPEGGPPQDPTSSEGGRRADGVDPGLRSAPEVGSARLSDPAFEPSGSPHRLALVESALRPGTEGYDFMAAVGAVRASNAWVVGGERSRSGKPLVANDMHLGLDKPTLWYLVGLHAPGLDVVGMSLPGTAGVVAGRTGAVAWGFTNAMVDDTELYLERVDPVEDGRYLTPEGSRPFETRTEIIGIRGGGADTLQVRSTRHGPIITPVEERAGDELLSLRWVALDPSTTPQALLDMNRATDVDGFLSALESFSDPHQNVVFADTAGTWGYWMTGRVPDRPGGRPPLVPVPGWTGEADWRGYLAFDEHPHAVNPPSGFVVTANNRQRWGSSGDRISAGTWASPYRARRIVELLDARADHDVESMHAIQMDVLSGLARDYRDVAARALAAAGDSVAARTVARWDGTGDLDSRASTLFHAWYDAVADDLRTTIYGDPDGYLAYGHVLAALERGLTDEQLTRTGRAALGADDASWGEVHRLVLDHPLAGVPVLGPLFGFGEEGIPRRGTPHTVNVAEYARGPDGLEVRWGPSQRHVADLADLDAGGFILPGGQSGWPGGEHAFDQFPLWRDGGLVSVPMTRARAESRTRARLTLVPAAS